MIEGGMDFDLENEGGRTDALGLVPGRVPEPPGLALPLLRTEAAPSLPASPAVAGRFSVEQTAVVTFELA